MQMMTALIGDPRGMTTKLLSEMRAAFEIKRGRQANETRGFVFRELKQLAVDYGLDTRLPAREGVATTQFFTFVRAMNSMVVRRVYQAQPNPGQEVIRRLAPFHWSRSAILAALERTKERRKSS